MSWYRVQALSPNSYRETRLNAQEFQSLSEQEKQRYLVEHFQRFPDDYVRYFFNIEPEQHQINALRAIAKPGARVAICGANGMGKDALVSWLPSWFLYCFGSVMGEHALVPTTSASGRQVDTLWREQNGWMSGSINGDAFHILVKELRLKWVEDHDGKRIPGDNNKALGFKALSQQVMESFHAPHLLYIMTEARACEDWAYLSMFKACTGEDNRIIIQSVPGEQTGMFYEIVRGEIPGWTVLTWPAARKVWSCPSSHVQVHDGACEDCDLETKSKYVPTSKQVSDQSIQEKLAFGEDSEFFQAPVLANFLTGSSLQLITLKQYHDAEDRYGPKRKETVNGIDIWMGGIVEENNDILGVDCAWVGQNQNVLCHRKGPVVYKFHRWQGNKGNQITGEGRIDTTDLIDRVMQWMNEYPHGTVVTEQGIAQASLIDHIIKAQYGGRLKLVNPGGPPLGGEKEEEMFHDRRSQLYYYVQQRFRNGNIAIKDNNDELKKQLTGIRGKVRTDVKFQIESKDELKKRMPSPDDADCYDSETDVLTLDGFKRFKDLDTSVDLIATLDSNGALEYQQAERLIQMPYVGPMHRIKSKYMDSMVTPNHKMFVNLGDKRYGEFKLHRAADIIGKPHTYKRDCAWNGVEQDVFTLPSVFEQKSSFGSYRAEPLEIKMDDWLRFFGYYISEGHSGWNQITISQKPDTRVWIEMRDFFADFTISSKNYKADLSGFIFHSRQLAKYLLPFGKAPKKFIPPWMKALSRRQLGILFQAMMDGDGSGNQYYTCSPKLRDDAMEIALKLGYSVSCATKNSAGDSHLWKDGRTRTHKHDLFTVSFQSHICTTSINHHRLWGTHDSWVDYNGIVYCVTVPNHIVYVRRNGRTMWSGNSLMLTMAGSAEIGSMAATIQDMKLIGTPVVYPAW